MGIQDFVKIDTSNHVSFEALKGNHFGKDVLSLQCPVGQIIKFIETDRSVQRDIIDYHVADIQRYIQYGLDGNNIYFPPIILSARGQGNYLKESNEYRLNLNDKLVLLDGQHRLKAFEIIIKRLEGKYDRDSMEKCSYIKNYPFTLQIFLDISVEEEKQLFTDVNTKASKANNTILLMYKNDDLCSELVKDIIENNEYISEDYFEVRAKSTRTKMMTAATLYNIIITLNESLLHTQILKNRVEEYNYEKYKEKTICFLKNMYEYYPLEKNSRNDSIIYIPKVLSALAYFVSIKLEETNITMEQLFSDFLIRINWSQENLDFKNIGLQYNENTKRYNITNGVRGMKMIYEYLENQYNGRFAK